MNFKEWLNSEIHVSCGLKNNSGTWVISNGNIFFFLINKINSFGFIGYKSQNYWEFALEAPEEFEHKFQEVKNYYNKVIKSITIKTLSPYLQDIKGLCQDEKNIPILADLMEENGFQEYSEILRNNKAEILVPMKMLGYPESNMASPAQVAFRDIRNITS